jgi:hypothetical protein
MSELCQHIKENGQRCQSVAMFRRDFCFYHWRFYTLQRVADAQTIEPPALDSECGVQLAASQIYALLAAGKLDPYRAQTMLASVGMVATSLRATDKAPSNDHVARELTPAMERRFAHAQPAPQPLPEKKGPASIEEIFNSHNRESL